MNREGQKPGMARLLLCVENNAQMQYTRKFQGFRAWFWPLAGQGWRNKHQLCIIEGFAAIGWPRGGVLFSHLRGFRQRNTDRGKGLLKPTFEK